jgi:complement component 5
MRDRGTCVVTVSAAKYKHPVPRKCCFDGARFNNDETCEQRVARVTIGPFCIRAFNECCILANQLRAKDSVKPMQLGRLRKCDVSRHNSAQPGGLGAMLCW